jgi:hypothetical protein
VPAAGVPVPSAGRQQDDRLGRHVVGEHDQHDDRDVDELSVSAVVLVNWDNPLPLVGRDGQQVRFRELTRGQQARLVLAVVTGMPAAVAAWKLVAYAI